MNDVDKMKTKKRVQSMMRSDEKRCEAGVAVVSEINIYMLVELSELWN